MRDPEIEVVEVITHLYKVTDVYGYTTSFESKEEATHYLERQITEKEALSHLKPKGVTLVVSKRPQTYYRVIAGYVGYNGVPFCKCEKEKDREHFMALSNTIERCSTIHGNIPEILGKVFNLLHGRSYFDRWDGAYHFHWNPAIGNPHCAGYDLSAWEKGALWYNWDGDKFTTNDPTCQYTDKDILAAIAKYK